MLQSDDSTFGAIDPALALRPPIAASQSTAALRPQAPAAQTTAAIAPRAAPTLIKPTQGDPLASYYEKLRQRESQGNDSAGNGVAYGRYQFTPQTWLGVAMRHPELGLDKTNIFDPAKQDLAVRALTTDNAAVLQKNGLEVTPENLSMLHFLGEGGGPKFLKALQAGPSANAAALFPLETRYNPTIFHDPAGRPRSLGEVYGLMTKSFGGEAPAQPGNGISANLQFAEGPKTVASDAAVDAEPPLPSGFVASDEPPLPSGFVATDKDNPYAVKLDKPAPQGGEITGVDEFGGPIFKDPKEQQEFLQGESTFTKGLLAGAARDITGPASLLPNALGGQKAQEATNYLNQTGDPLSRGIGGMLPFALAGPEMAALQPSVSAALIGGGSGLAAGTQGSSKETSALGRLNEKLPTMLEEGAAGAALGSLGPAALAGAKWLGSEATGLAKTVTGAYEREAKKTVEELRIGVDAETGKALTATERRAAEKAMQEAEAETKRVGQAAELRRIEEAQAKLKLRDEIRAQEGRDARQALDPEAAAQLKTQVVQRVRDRVFEAEKAAKEAGRSAEDAKAFAVDQERARSAAEQSAEQLVEQFRNRMPATKEELGNQIRKNAVKDMEELKLARERDSGYAAAVKSDGGGPSVPTRQFLKRVDEAETRAKSPEMHSALAILRGQLRTKVANGQITSVPIAGARRIIQDMDGRISALGKSGHKDEADELEKMKDDFVEYLEAKHPALKTAREKYAEMSRPLDVYRDTGVLAKPAKSDLYSENPVMDSTRITGALLNRTEDGADALARLTARDPNMLDTIRGYFNHEFFGPGRSIAPRSFEKALDDNRLALERVGLGGLKDVETAEKLFSPNSIEFRGKTYSGNSRLEALQAAQKDTGHRIDLERISNEANDNAARTPHAAASGPDRGPLATEFERLGSQLRSKQEGVLQAKVSEQSAAEQAKLAEQTRKGAIDKVSEERGLLEKAKKREAETVKTTEKAAATPADAAAEKAKADEARLREQQTAVKNNVSSTDQDVSRLASERASAETARGHYLRVQSWLKEANVKEVPAQIKGIVDRLHADNFISDTQMKEFTEAARKAKDSLEAATNAKRLVRYVILPAIVTTTGFGGEYLYHKVRP